MVLVKVTNMKSDSVYFKKCEQKSLVNQKYVKEIRKL